MKFKKYICEERIVTQDKTPLPVYDYISWYELEFESVVKGIKNRFDDELRLRNRRVIVRPFIDEFSKTKETAVIHYFSKYDEYISSVYITRDWSYHE